MRDDRNELAGMLKETFTDILTFYFLPSVF